MDSQAGPPPGEDEYTDGERLPVNSNPTIFVDGFYLVKGLIEQYGWILLALSFLVVYAIYRLRPYIEKLMERRQEQDYYKKYDAGTALQRQEAMEAHRRKLQEVHDRQAAEHAEIQKEREEKKRQEKIEDWDRHQEGKGYRSKIKSQEPSSASGSGAKPANKPKKPLRDPDYNPLTGMSGGGASYRPARRGGAGGG